MSAVQVENALEDTFGLWSAISLGWLTLNVFGGMSFALFVSLSAGGLPVLLYGFIGSSAAVLCVVLTLAQCASRFSTAGGAYHYSCFLVPEKYRRQVAYPLGWLNYFGWIFTHAGACAVVATLIMSLVNLCNPDVAVTTRWQLFLLYMAVVTTCWAVNLRGLKSIPTLELFGCYATALGFVAYTIALLVKAPKASVRSVFVDINNETGYDSTGIAVVLGLLNSFAALMGLDGPTHLAEEIPQPRRHLPRILIIVIISQFFVGVVWILALGFSITDLSAVRNTSTGVPILELVRLATGSNAAAIVLCVILIINNGTSALGSAVAMSRQGYAFARDGGLFWNSKLTEMSARTHLPFWSINVPSAIVGLVGLIYLFSNAAYNAIIGAQGVCMIISFGAPAMVLLITQGDNLPKSDRWNFGIFSIPIYVVSVAYSALVTIVCFVGDDAVAASDNAVNADASFQIPQLSPVTSLTMNYTILVMGVFGVAMGLAWMFEGRKLFSPPVNDEEISAVSEGVIQGVMVDAESQAVGLDSKSGYNSDVVVSMKSPVDGA